MPQHKALCIVPCVPSERSTEFLIDGAFFLYSMIHFMFLTFKYVH
jgi:hypothetical protein